jgi:hypothetical protein
MGRDLKIGFGYFPLDTDIFSNNKKIKALRRAHGSIGLLTYLSVVCRIYYNGYFFKFDDLEELAMDIAEEIANEQFKRVAARVTETINYLVERGMLDEALFKQGIISGVAMQEQYVRSAYTAKRKIVMDVHCLVDVGDCIRKIRKSSEEKGISSEEKQISSEESTQSKRESKKENNNSLLSLSYMRAKERNENIEKYGKWENVYLTSEEYDELESVIPHFSDYVDYFSNKLIDRGYQYSNHYETIISWWNTDRYTVGDNFGVDEIWNEVFESFLESKKG